VNAIHRNHAAFRRENNFDDEMNVSFYTGQRLAAVAF
jgi:hypothetical protein